MAAKQEEHDEEAPVLARATESATVGVPIEAVDLSKWIFALTDTEYCQCAPGEHKACGCSRTEDGRPISICVEDVGGQLMIQHYVGEEMSPSYCRMVSQSDCLSNGKWSTVKVTWEVRVDKIDDESCSFSNSIVSQATPEFLQQLEDAGISVEDAAAQRTDGITAHNRRETPNFAASVERLARRASDARLAGH
jgi:hypothetical protein